MMENMFGYFQKLVIEYEIDLKISLDRYIFVEKVVDDEDDM